MYVNQRPRCSLVALPLRLSLCSVRLVLSHFVLSYYKSLLSLPAAPTLTLTSSWPCDCYFRAPVCTSHLGSRCDMQGRTFMINLCHFLAFSLAPPHLLRRPRRPLFFLIFCKSTDDIRQVQCWPVNKSVLEFTQLWQQLMRSAFNLRCSLQRTVLRTRTSDLRRSLLVANPIVLNHSRSPALR